MRPTYPQLSGGSAFLRHLTALMQLQLLNLVDAPASWTPISEFLAAYQIFQQVLQSFSSTTVIQCLQKEFLRQETGLFCLQDLSHCCERRSLNVPIRCVSFGEGSDVADLHQIKVLVLDGATAGLLHRLLQHSYKTSACANFCL